MHGQDRAEQADLRALQLVGQHRGAAAFGTQGAQLPLQELVCGLQAHSTLWGLLATFLQDEPCRAGVQALGVSVLL